MINCTSSLVVSMAFALAGEADFHELIRKGEVDKVKAALAARPELKSIRDKMQMTPLHTAAAWNKVEIVKLLLEAGVVVDERAYNEFTPLRLTESPEVVKLLIAHKADVNAKCLGETALHRAADRLRRSDKTDEKQWREITKLLLDAGADCDVLAATYLGDLDRIKALVKADPKQALSKNAMREAARYGLTDIVKFLLANKADPDDADFGGMTVLYFATAHPEVVKALLEAGADFKSPLKDKRSFASGPLPDGNTILHEAARKGHARSVKLLLDAGAEVDALDPSGRTPILHAAFGGWPEAVVMLRKYKASLAGGVGPKAMAAAVHHVYYAEQQADEVKRNRELIRYLEKEGIAVDLRGAIVLGEADRIKKLLKDKPLVQTPLLPREKPLLHLAVGLNQKDTVELLLDAGAPIEAADDSEYTPLIDAAFWGRDDIAALLIARGAKLDARTRDGTTPLSEAVRCKQKTTIELLKKHGAKE